MRANIDYLISLKEEWEEEIDSECLVTEFKGKNFLLVNVIN